MTVLQFGLNECEEVAVASSCFIDFKLASSYDGARTTDEAASELWA
jgi:hypothetical protein